MVLLCQIKVIILQLKKNDGLSFKDFLLKKREHVFREVMPERIANDYLRVIPHYYEVNRMEWLLRHCFFYKVYRLVVSLGMKLMK